MTSTPSQVSLHDGDGLHVGATLEPTGDVVIDGHDLRNGEYEYWVRVAAADVPALVAALGGGARAKVLRLLDAHREEIVSAGPRTWLTERGIPSSLFTQGGW
jgi:hypothetical protein